MVLTVRASVIFLPSGVINVWGTAILFISLLVYNNYKVLLINYSSLKLHLQIFIEAVSSLFYIEASSSSFIWGPCLHNLFWGLVLIGLFKTLSLDFSLRLPVPHHCYVILLRLCSFKFEVLILSVVDTCCSCLYCIFDLFAGYVCDSVPLYLCLGKLMQILFGLNLPFSFFAFYANFLFFNCVIHYFGLQVHAARLILSLVFVGSPVLICVDIIVPCSLWGAKRLMLPSPHHIITFNFVVLFEEFTVESVCFGVAWDHALSLLSL